MLIPDAVHREVVYNTKDHGQSEAISKCDFIQVHSILSEQFVFSRQIDKGEAEAIILAIALNANYLLLDDKRAQKEAIPNGINLISTFSVVLKAAQKGYISDIDSVITELQQKNIFLNRELSLAAKSFLDLN